MNNPFISIVIPTYNRAWCINRAIDSCLAQVYQNFEIVITDDGSTDNTISIIKSYNNKKIKYFKFKENQGVIKARNNSIKNSIGDWIILFDSDDELNQNCLEILVKNINNLPNNKNIKIIFSHFINTLNQKTTISKKFQDIIKKSNILTYHDFICTGGASIGDALPIVRKDVFEKIPYDTNVKRNMAVIWHQLFKISDVLFIDDYLGVCHTEGVDRITMNRERDAKLWVDGIKEYIRIFHSDILSFCPKTLSTHYRSLGLYQFQLHEIQDSRKSFLTAIKYNVFDYKSIIYLFASFNKKIFQKLLDK